jgi:hypothetical protein
MIWLSLAAFVYCLFRWYCESIRGRFREAAPTVQQNIDAHRNSLGQAHLLINDPDDDVPPVVTTPVPVVTTPVPVVTTPVPKIAEYLSPEEELDLESIIGAASRSLDVNEVPLKLEDNLQIAEHEYGLLVDGLEKLLLESDERLPEHGGLFLADGSATNLDCLELGSQTTLSGSEAEGLHTDLEIRVFTQ